MQTRLFAELVQLEKSYFGLQITSPFLKANDHFLTCRLTVEKLPSHPLARRHRADIEGCANVDNVAFVVSAMLCEFKFPHEVDVHKIVSTELLGNELLLQFLYGVAKLGQGFLSGFPGAKPL